MSGPLYVEVDVRYDLFVLTDLPKGSFAPEVVLEPETVEWVQRVTAEYEAVQMFLREQHREATAIADHYGLREAAE